MGLPLRSVNAASDGTAVPAAAAAEVALRFGGIAFERQPYPIGVVRPALDEAFYRALVDGFPPLELFKAKPEKGGKFSLSQVNHAGKYRRFLAASPPWRRFHAYVKSPHFIGEVLAMLRREGIDLGLERPNLYERCRLKARALLRGSPLPHFPRLKTRFEFSAMPASGGNILPHTDDPGKVATLVMPMLGAGEWNPDWGGGTAVVWPKDESKIFNRVNGYLEFDEVECLKTFPFEPNQCLVFVKTYDSWHAVWPMTGPDPNVLRRTITINIERS